MKTRFGPAGNSESFQAMGYRKTIQVPEYLARMGLDAYEYQCGRGVRISTEAAQELIQPLQLLWRCIAVNKIADAEDRIRLLLRHTREQRRVVLAVFAAVQVAEHDGANRRCEPAHGGGIFRRLERNTAHSSRDAHREHECQQQRRQRTADAFSRAFHVRSSVGRSPYIRA